MDAAFQSVLDFYSTRTELLAQSQLRPDKAPSPGRSSSGDDFNSKYSKKEGKRITADSNNSPSSNSSPDTDDGLSVITGRMSPDQVFRVLDSFQRCIRFAEVFNNDLPMRRKLFSAGFVKDNNPTLNALPDLFTHYAHGISLSLQLLLRMYLDETLDSPDSKTGAGGSLLSPSPSRPDIGSSFDSDTHPLGGTGTEVEKRLIRLSRELFNEYVAKTRGPDSGGVAVGAGAQIALHYKLLVQDLDPVACLLLRTVRTDFSVAQGSYFLRVFYTLLVDLIELGSAPIRREIRQLFASRLRSLLPFGST